MSDVVEGVLSEENSHNLTRNSKEFEFFCNIYERVNSSNDEIKKQYKNNLLIKFDEIKELHEKTFQTIRSLKPTSVGLKINISQNEGESENFESFEDFESHKVTSPKPTNSVYFVYNFSIFDKDSNVFETYKVKIRIISRVSMLAEFEKEAPSFMPPTVLASLATPTVIIAIEYADYIKARNFISMSDEWVKGCEESGGSKIIHSLKRYSHFLPKIGKNIIYILLAYYTINAIGQNDFDNAQLGKLIIFYMTSFIVLGSLAAIFLSKLEQSIDSYMSVSYIDMNKGDKKLIRKYENRNRSSLFWSAIGLLGTIGIGVLTNTIYELMKGYIV